jgi:membrane protein DedA with SNARE-associated domain
MKLVAIACAVAVAGLTIWRWRRVGWLVRGCGAALSVALVLYGAGIVRLPQLENTVDTIGSTLGPYTYALVGVMAFLETAALVGLVVPGETIVIVGGVIAGQGHVDVLALFALTWLCALSGDATGYLLGRRLGRRFLLTYGPRVHLTTARLRGVEEYFARYGLATILIGRFVGLVRAVAPFLAGASRYPLGRFIAIAGVGTGLWSAAFVFLGFIFWQSFDQAIAIAKHGTLALSIIVVLIVSLVAIHRHARARRRAGANAGADRRRQPAARPHDEREVASRSSAPGRAARRLDGGRV